MIRLIIFSFSRLRQIKRQMLVDVKTRFEVNTTSSSVLKVKLSKY